MGAWDACNGNWNACFSYQKDERAKPRHLRTNWCSFCPHTEVSLFPCASFLLFYFYISLSLPPPSQCFRMKTFTIPRFSLKYWDHSLRVPGMWRHRDRQRSRSGSVLSVGWPTYLRKDLPTPDQFQMHRWGNKKTITDSRNSVNYVGMIPNTFTGQISQ